MKYRIIALVFIAFACEPITAKITPDFASPDWFWRTPAYPLLLQCLGPTVLVLLQHLALALAVLVLTSDDEGHAVEISLLCFLDVRLLVYGQMLTPDALFAALLAIALTLAHRPVLQGVLFAVATLLKPVGFLWPIVYLAVSRSRKAVIAAAIGLALPGMWVVRNHVVHGYLGLTPSGAMYFYDQVLPHLDPNGPTHRELRRRLASLAIERGTPLNVTVRVWYEFKDRGWSVVQFDRAIRDLVAETPPAGWLEYLKDRPRNLAAYLLTGGPGEGLRLRNQSWLVRPRAPTGLIVPPRNTTSLHLDPLSLAFHALMSPPAQWLLVTLAIFGIKRTGLTPQVALLAYLVVMHCALTSTGERHRLAAEPMLLLMAARGLPMRRQIG